MKQISSAFTMVFRVHAVCLVYAMFSPAVSLTASAPLQSPVSPGMAETIDRLVSGGQIAQADSLCGALDNRGITDPELFIRWAGIQATLGRYSRAAGLSCRLLSTNQRSLDRVLGDLYYMLDNAPKDTIAVAIGIIRECALNVRGIDTIRVQFGCADFYVRHGMEAAELQMLASVSRTAPQLVPRLLGMARERLRQGAIGKAVPPAGMAFDRAAGDEEKALAAELLYQAHQALRNYDSAVIWLDKAGITNDSRRIGAAALYQSTGKLAEAKKIIGTVAPSLGRDTIELRQCIFGGDLKCAADLARKKAESWVQRPGDVFLWKVRILLFGGAFDELQSLFDSCPIEPSWMAAGELLDYRYRLQIFNRSAPSLSTWSRIEYDIYTGNVRRAVQRFAGQRLPPECTEALRLRVIRELLALGDAASASVFFSQPGEADDSPELLYIRALVELANGREPEARKYLLRVIGDFPEDVFSEKARIALQELRQQR